MSETNDLAILLDSGSDHELQSFLKLLQRDEVLELILEFSPAHADRILNFLHPSEVAALLGKLPTERWQSRI